MNETRKLGIDDVLLKHGHSILSELLREAWRFDGHRRPKKVHLSQIEDAAVGNSRIAIDVMVSAIGETYILPKVIALHCGMPDKKRKAKLQLVASDGEAVEPSQDEGSNAHQCAHMGVEGGRWEHEICHPQVLIDFTGISFTTLNGRLQAYAFSLCKNAVYERTVSCQTVTCFLATPKARRLRSLLQGRKSEVFDEAGMPFREKVVYYLGKLDEASRYYRGIGLALPNPKSQQATAFFYQMLPLADEFESFQVTPSLRTAFSVFQSAPGEVIAALEKIVRDITDYITQIFGDHRRRSLLGKLLVFHSVLQFRFDGELLKRGWVEMLEVGDTGQGKTQQVDRLIQAADMGEGVDGVSTTRTGLAYSFQKHNDSWFLVWGKYPLNDGKLLFVDEAQNLRPEDIDKIRKGRSDGLIAADGIRSGEHPTRTRLIATCNPRFQGVVDDQLFGIDLVKETFKDEDIRRFDFAIISSASDEKAEINQPRVQDSSAGQMIRPEILAASIKWAWSRKPEHVVFTNDATLAVYELARRLSSLYGEARDIPLLLESDVRHKLARLAVAMAALLHSTDESHEQVIVEAEHVQAVERFLRSIYEHSNCSFDLYARMRHAETSLTDEEYQTTWHALRQCEVDTIEMDGHSRPICLSDQDLMTLLRAFVTHSGAISRQDLAGELGKSAAWTSKIVRVLKTNRLIRVFRGRSGGYQATARFTRFLKLAIQRGELEA